MSKKAFQLNANHPLVNSLRFIVNKFEHAWGAGGGGARALYRGVDLAIKTCTEGELHRSDSNSSTD